MNAQAAIFVFTAVLVFSSSVNAQSANSKFAAALEDQIRCSEKPEPYRAIRALQRAGLVKRNYYINVDSLSYFRVQKPLEVFGMKVVAVIGFDAYPMFGRGPGTSPGTTIGVVVPFSVNEVKRRLAGLPQDKIMIDEAEDQTGPTTPKNRTEISCPEYAFS